MQILVSLPETLQWYVDDSLISLEVKSGLQKAINGPPERR